MNSANAHGRINMSDLFDDEENLGEEDVLISTDEKIQVVNKNPILDARKRLENILEEKRLRDELRDEFEDSAED